MTLKGRVFQLSLAAALAVAIGACGPPPELVCTYESFESCQAAAAAALDAVDDRSAVTSVTIKPPDGTWRREGARYLSLAIVRRGEGDVTVLRVWQFEGEPMKARVMP